VASSTDPGPEIVAAWLLVHTDKDPVSFFGKVIRKSVDEVLDGPRTGRWDFEQLEKTEQTYVGTKLEIVARTELGLEQASFMDLDIEGFPVDIKWSKTSAWQIPREAVEQLCLCVGGLKHMTHFQVGIVRCDAEHLNLGSNRDGKTTLSRAGRAAMQVIVPPTPIPPNFVADMDPNIRYDVMREPTIQKRVTKLFQSLPHQPIPRDAIRTVAQTEGDPMRRLRADAHAGDPLGGYKIMSAKYANKIVQVLGYPALAKDEFMAIPMAEILMLPLPQRREAGFDL
jgi:hypothetical protein